MDIKECKRCKLLPKKGMQVRTVINTSTNLPIHKTFTPYIGNRRSGEGMYDDFVAGSSGDWWWVRHTDGAMAIYSSNEVFDID